MFPYNKNVIKFPCSYLANFFFDFALYPTYICTNSNSLLLSTWIRVIVCWVPELKVTFRPNWARKWKIVSFSNERTQSLNLYVFFSFTPYPSHIAGDAKGTGDRKVKTFCIHQDTFIPHFPLNSRGIACLTAELKASICLLTEKMKILNISLGGIEPTTITFTLSCHWATTVNNSNVNNILS